VGGASYTNSRPSGTNGVWGQITSYDESRRGMINPKRSVEIFTESFHPYVPHPARLTSLTNSPASRGELKQHASGASPGLVQKRYFERIEIYGLTLVCICWKIWQTRVGGIAALSSPQPHLTMFSSVSTSYPLNKTHQRISSVLASLPDPGISFMALAAQLQVLFWEIMR
jgi:hypothetical protein